MLLREVFAVVCGQLVVCFDARELLKYKVEQELGRRAYVKKCSSTSPDIARAVVVYILVYYNALHTLQRFTLHVLT